MEATSPKTISVVTQMKTFSSKFEKDISMVSFLSSNTALKNVWYVDNGAPRNMTSSIELFSILTNTSSGFQVELGDYTKYSI